MLFNTEVMGQRKILYTIHVEDRYVCCDYVVKAASVKEAKQKAKAKFIKEIYKERLVKTSMVDKEVYYG